MMVETTSRIGLERRLIPTIRVSTPLVIAGAYIWRLSGGADPLVRFSDDFFYYLLPARNLVNGAGSTFFVGEPTNGYHPLWFLWISLLNWLAGDGAVFFALVDLTILVLLIGFFFAFERFLSGVTKNSAAAAVGASVAAIPLSVLSMAGVETALAAFASALLLAYLCRKPASEHTVRDAALIGLMCAFVLLSRLDAVALLLGLAVAILPRWDLRRVSAAVAGATPIYVYLAVNYAVFGQLDTTSMAAKSLGVYWPPNWWFILHPSAVVGWICLFGIVLTSVAVVVLLRGASGDDAKRMVLAVAAAPLLQLVGQALFSGWVLFPWYFYLYLETFGLAAALATVEMARRKTLRRFRMPLGAVVAIGLVRILVGGLSPDPWQVEIAAVAQRIAAFSVSHPGVYAMGDAAGTPAWLSRQPIVHLEGLMMSQDFIDRIRQRQPLDRVFSDYRVSYYISVRGDGLDANGCQRFSEPDPEQSSPRAPRMETSICQPPVETFRVGPRYQVRIYRLDPETGRAVAVQPKSG
jgi:hypothetical protein